MADLNNQLISISKKGEDVQTRLKELLVGYDNLLREGNRMLLEERMASDGSWEGLDDFVRLMHLLKRNRDIRGSMCRGIASVRSMSGFKFIEEDIADRVDKKKKKPKRKITQTELFPEELVTESLSEPDFSALDTTITEEAHSA